MPDERPISVATPDNSTLVDRSILEHAFSFAAAADAYSARGYTAAKHVLSFLLGRSIELAYKAYLIRQGATEARLRKLGHSLAALQAAAEETGFSSGTTLSMQDCEVIRFLDTDYRDKSFEYPERRITTGYNEGLVRTVTDKVLRGAAVAIWGLASYEELQAATRNRYSGMVISDDAYYG